MSFNALAAASYRRSHKVSPTVLPIRKQDSQGAGYFGAPRGSRKHKGIDLCCEAVSVVSCMAPGTVTKVGYPYRMDDDLKGHLRYVEVTQTATSSGTSMWNPWLVLVIFWLMGMLLVFPRI